MTPLQNPLHTLASLGSLKGGHALELSQYLRATGHPAPTDEDIAGFWVKVFKEEFPPNSERRPRSLTPETMQALMDFCGERILSVPFQPQDRTKAEPLWEHLLRWLPNRQTDATTDLVLQVALQKHGEDLLARSASPEVLLHRITAGRSQAALEAFLTLPSAPRSDILLKRRHPVLGDYEQAAFSVHTAHHFEVFARHGTDITAPTAVYGPPLWAKVWRQNSSDASRIRPIVDKAVEAGLVDKDAWEVEWQMVNILKQRSAADAMKNLERFLPNWASLKNAQGVPVGLLVAESFSSLLPDLVKQGMALTDTAPWGDGLWLYLARCDRAPSQKVLGMLKNVPISLNRYGHGLAGQLALSKNWEWDAAWAVFKQAPAKSVFAGFDEKFTQQWFKTSRTPPGVDGKMAYLLVATHPDDLGLLSPQARGDMALALLSHAAIIPDMQVRKVCLHAISSLTGLGLELDPGRLVATEQFLAHKGGLEYARSGLDMIKAQSQQYQISQATPLGGGATRARM